MKFINKLCKNNFIDKLCIKQSKTNNINQNCLVNQLQSNSENTNNGYNDNGECEKYFVFYADEIK